MIKKTLPQNLITLLEDFSEITDTRERFEFLIELAEELPEFSKENKTRENKIIGCASDAWVVVSEEKKSADFDSAQSPILKISGTGEAVISKGVLAFFHLAFKGCSAQEILNIPKNIFLESRVINSLSPSRSNGANAMLDKIYSECEKLV